DQPVPDIDRELPESVRGLVQKKIDRLSADERRLLAAASVQGCEFDAAVLAAEVGLTPAAVADRPEGFGGVPALAQPLREKDGPDGTWTVRYGFVHTFYQNALYAGLRPARRTAWSAAVAQALLRRHRDRPAVVAVPLAFLFEAARDMTRAAE